MPETIEGVHYLTAAEAAAALGVKVETLYAYASRGRLRSYRRGIGRGTLYRVDQVEALTRVRPHRVDDLPPAGSWMDGHA